MKLIIFIGSFVLISLKVAEAINCYSGINATTTSVPGCTSCQRTAAFLNSGVVVSTSSCLSASCVATDNVVAGNGVKVLCCSTDNCNNQAVSVNTAVDMSGSGGSSSGGGAVATTGYSCYNENNSVSTGCAYCMRTTTNLVVSTQIVRSCVSVCLPVNAVVYKTECCQTNLCNHAPSLLSPSFLTYFSAIVLAALVYMGGV